MPSLADRAAAARTRHLHRTFVTPVAVTVHEQLGLLAALASMPDPRDPRGVRYPLASMLAVAVCAVLAGAVTFTAIADCAGAG